MEDENNQQVVSKQETTEVVTPPGSSSTVNDLSNIFDKIETGKSEGRNATEVIAEERKAPKAPRPSAPKEEKKEATTTTTTEEKPKEEKPKEDKKESDEVSRDKLRNRFESAQEKPSEKQATEETSEEEGLPEGELQPQPHDKPKTVQRIKQLWSKVKKWEETAATTKKELEEKASKLAELEKQLSAVKTVNPEEDERIKAKLDELQMYRRRYELDNDPEIKNKYDKRVEESESSIVETLKARRAGDALLAIIKEEGGWVKFSKSSRTIPINDGAGGVTEVPASEVADNILAALPLGERKSIEAAMVEQVQTQREKERFLKEQQETAVAYFKKKEEEATGRTAAQQRQIEEAKKFITEYEQKTLSSEWLKDKEVPTGATAAEKASITEHNRQNAELRQLFKKSITTTDLPGLMEIITDSVRFYDERRTTASLRKELEAAKTQIAAKQAEIDKIRGGARSVAKPGSIISAPAHEASPDERPSSLEDAFDRIEREKNR